MRRFPPEMELLLACARRTLRDQDLSRARRAVDAGLDWESVLRLARRHGLLPLLHSHVTSGVIEASPSVASTLRRQSERIARRNLLLTGELLRILRTCGREGLAVVPLKGPVLSEAVYGSVAMRQYRDLDLLCRWSDLRAVAAVLAEHGYAMEALLPANCGFAYQQGHHLAAYSARHTAAVEVHYALLTPYGQRPIDLESLRPRLQQRTFMGVEIEVLGAEEEFVYLCAHGAEHAWQRLEWIATIAERLQADMDWGRISAYAREIGAARRVEGAVTLAAHLLNVASHQPAATAPRAVSRATGYAIEKLLEEAPDDRRRGWQVFVYQMLMDVSLGARLRRAVGTYLLPSVADLRECPEWLVASPARYLLRPLAVVRRRFKPRSRPSSPS